MRRRPNSISLFSGCGGCSIGLERAGFSINLAVDFDEEICSTYSHNLGGDHLWNKDIEEVRPKNILDKSNIENESIDLIVGGPPCQGFSSAGSREWDDPRNSLLKRFVDIVTDLRPTWFIMENVEGLLTLSEGFHLIESVVRFLDAGYWVNVKKVYMNNYGLPQRRKRVFVVGNLENCWFKFPEPTHVSDSTNGQASLFQEDNCNPLSIMDAIGDLPKKTSSGKVKYGSEPKNSYQERHRGSKSEVDLHYSTPPNELDLRRMSHLDEGQAMKDLPDELQHDSFERRAKRRVKDGMPTEKRGGPPQGMKRLVGDEPSLTITSASPREFVHPAYDRPLTLRECARVQSFPDEFTFKGTKSSIATQIGNAIPPLFMEVLAKHINGVADWDKKYHDRGNFLGIDATKSSAKSPALSSMIDELNRRTAGYHLSKSPQKISDTTQWT